MAADQNEEAESGRAVAVAASPNYQRPIEDFDPPKKPKRNKYAFACAILASMTSILLGYGT